MKDETYQRFGGNLRNRRRQRGITQEYLAGMMGINRETISQWENAVHGPSCRDLARMADLLSTTMDELWSGPKTTRSKCPTCERYRETLPGGSWAVCPKCEKEGCDDCLPGGRNCLCPECEESGESD